MKVTVCFRDIKIVVPCGDGSGLVKGLLEESLARYKKAQTKNVDSSWLNPNTVKLLLCDGGILDLDDRINDVIDDKEQIRAIVNGKSDRSLQENADKNGDGTSESSLGTCSPDIFRDNLGERDGEEMGDVLGNGRRDVIITRQDFLSGSGLSVRRGSEPALCTSSDLDSSGIELSTEYPIYSAISRKSGGNSRKESLGSNFKAGRWTNAAGQTSETQQSANTIAKSSEDQETEQQNTEMIFVLPKSKEALGIHVVPAFDDEGRNIGLLIEKIERGGRADRDHRLKIGDKITEINFQNLFQVDFSRAQEIFRSSFLAPELQIKALRPVRPSSLNSLEPKDQNNSVSTSAGVEPKLSDITKRTPPAVPVRSPAARLSLKGSARLTMYTKSIDLIKGPNGLGFSVTTHGTRDGDCSPIYIKHIFSVGAAVEEGHLKPGDVLLEINGSPLADKTKAEAVKLLRNLPTGSSVHLLISRALTMHETAVQKRTDRGRRPVAQRPFSLTGFRQASASSCSEEDVTEQDAGAKENTTSYRKCGSMSNIAKSGLSDDFNEEEDEPNVASKLRADKQGSAALTLQKSRKSISLDDLRRQNSAESGVEIAFDDSTESPVAFHKMRDFNQSFRAAIIDKKAARSRPTTGSGSESAEYIAAIEKADKLRQNGVKKNKSKKDQERGSGRKFSWLFRFGKGRKSDSECIRMTQPEVPGNKIVANKIETPLVQKPPYSNSSLTVPEPKNVNLHQPSSSQPSGQSRHLLKPEKPIESSYVRLHKEDYMITAVPSQKKPSRQDISQIHSRHAAASVACGELQSCERPQEVHDNLREQLGRHEKTNNQYSVQHQQQQKYHHPHSSNVHRKSALSGPGDTYRNWMSSETADPSRRFNRQDVLPSGGDRQPSLKYRHEDITGLRSYKTNCDLEHYPQFIKPDVSDLFPKRNLPEPSARSGHYYRRDNYGGQTENFRQQHSPYAKDSTWGDQVPMDLSRHTAVGPQDRADVSYGYRSQEYDLHTRQHISSNLKISHQPSSNYPPYKSFSPNITKDLNLSRERHARQMDVRTGTAVEQRRHSSYRHPNQLWQNNPAVVTERW